MLQLDGGMKVLSTVTGRMVSTKSIEVGIRTGAGWPRIPGSVHVLGGGTALSRGTIEGRKVDIAKRQSGNPIGTLQQFLLTPRLFFQIGDLARL